MMISDLGLSEIFCKENKLRHLSNIEYRQENI